MAVINKLQDDKQLLNEVNVVLATSAATPSAREWYDGVLTFIQTLAAATPTQLSDRPFLEALWNQNPIAAVGNGTVNVEPALDDSNFRTWFAEAVRAPLPSGTIEQEAHLVNLYDEFAQRLQGYGKRVARLKLNRVLCALFPEHFTTLADEGALRVLHRAMGGSAADHVVHAHKSIRTKLDRLLGAPESIINAHYIERICLPWYLYERIREQADQPSKNATSAVSPKESNLKPLPAIRRPRGLLAMKGYFQFLMAVAQELTIGLSKDELVEVVRRDNQTLTESSVNTIISALRREFDLYIREGDTYRLSARGFNLLNSGDADELADHFITQILGIDHILMALRNGALTKAGLFSMLRGVNPGWTTNFSPSAMLAWLTSMEVVCIGPEGSLSLTDRGKSWAAMVTWTPESLPPLPIDDEEPNEVATAVGTVAMALPAYSEALSRLNLMVAGKLSYPPALVNQLHAGLWFNARRHFLVMTGLSGSGKTQLAVNYALSLCNESVLNGSKRVLVVPVQPSWFDPVPLLGQANPLERGYRPTPFLKLLQRASEDPMHPYVVILDEMNLSHPEQYLAPILSAMETGSDIDLHQLGPDVTDIPPSLPYPSNLAIIGTVNMDETTHGLSDKVLDRAYTLEFWNIAVADFPHWESSPLSIETKRATKRVLEGLSTALSPVRMHFGWRTIADVLEYMQLSVSMNVAPREALDAAVYAKVLPKLRGEDTNRFRNALAAVQQLLGEEKLERCERKVQDLLDDVVQTGTARFWR